MDSRNYLSLSYKVIRRESMDSCKITLGESKWILAHGHEFLTLIFVFWKVSNKNIKIPCHWLFMSKLISLKLWLRCQIEWQNHITTWMKNHLLTVLAKFCLKLQFSKHEHKNLHIFSTLTVQICNAWVSPILLNVKACWKLNSVQIVFVKTWWYEN